MTDYVEAADNLINGASKLVELTGTISQPTGQGQLLRAAMAQLGALQRRQVYTKAGVPRQAFALIPEVYPKDWKGFRDYGSDVANIVIAMALLREEVKRKILLGESVEVNPLLPMAKQPEIAHRELKPKPTEETKP